MGPRNPESENGSQGDIDDASNMNGDPVVSNADQPEFQVFPRQWQRKAMAEDVSNKRRFTVVTYNLLTDLCIRDGQYTYCPREIRYMAARHPRIMVELREMDADVVCLQEVDHMHYRDVLKADMAAMGYDGVYHHRLDDQGLATFYKQSQFHLAEQRHVVFKHAAETHLQMSGLSVAERCQVVASVERPEAALFVRLRHEDSGATLCLGNLHIAWTQLRHPALQAYQVAVAIDEMCLLAGVGREQQDACVLVGDFNTPPDFPAYSLLATGQLNAAATARMAACESTAETKSLCAMQTEQLKASGLVAALPSLLKHRLPLHSAYQTITDSEPEVTNCDDACQDELIKICLDYLWFSHDSLEVAGVLRTPPVDAITKHHALPSELFPSDHIPLLAEFVFK